ncbi:MAG TPA: CbiX/SirB N-terminal domain-containing protein [Burkholderiaceae bacterium]|jgi:sirohydrochlorin cobaltochelatase
MDGLLLFAHGARDPAWSRPFEAVAQGIAARTPGMPMALAYLEFMSPNMEAAAQSLAAAGCTTVHIVPLFLGAGGHVRKDVPALIERLQAQHGPQISWRLHSTIGDHPLVTEAMAEAALQYLGSQA